MKLSSYTLALLDDIERRIDPETEEDYRAQWKAFWYGVVDEPIVRPTRKRTVAPSIEVKPIHINDAQRDLELMLDYELMLLSGRVASPTSSLGIRANYGVGIIPTMFGAVTSNGKRIFGFPKPARYVHLLGDKTGVLQ